MARAQRGSLHIVAVQDEVAREQAAALLAASEDIPQERAEQELTHLPLLLREDIPRPEASEIAEYLHELGVEARFDPHGRKDSEKAAKKAGPAKSEKSAKATQSRASSERPREERATKPGKAAALRRLSPGRDLLILATLFALAVGVVVWVVLQGY